MLLSINTPADRCCPEDKTSSAYVPALFYTRTAIFSSTNTITDQTRRKPGAYRTKHQQRTHAAANYEPYPRANYKPNTWSNGCDARANTRTNSNIWNPWTNGCDARANAKPFHARTDTRYYYMCPRRMEHVQRALWRRSSNHTHYLY